MKFNILFKNILIFIVMSGIFLFSCSTRGQILAVQKNSVDFSFSMKISALFVEMFQNMGVENSDNMIFDIKNIRETLEKEGIVVKNIDNSVSGTLLVSGTITKADEFFKKIDGKFEQTQDKNGGSYHFELSTQSFQKLIENTGEGIQAYTNALFAPIFTQENLTETEYIDLLSTLYGQEIANELKNSFVYFDFFAPKNIKNVLFLPFDPALYGKKATVKIPMSVFLTTQENLKILVEW